MFKKTLYIFLVLFGAVLVLWIGLNFWPYEEPPDLFDQSELVLPPEAASPENGWNLLKGRDELPEVHWSMSDSDPTLIFEKTSDPQAYWNYFFEHQEEISKSIDANEPALKFYFNLLDAPYFIDNDPPTFAESSPSLIDLLDYHKLTWLYLSRLAADGKIEGAYALWLKIFYQDMSWVKSARTLISHMISMASLVGDLEILRSLRSRWPEAPWGEVEQQLKELNQDSFNFKRAIVFEYIQTWNAFEDIREKASKIREPHRHLINFALSKRTHNQIFTQHLNLLKDPLHPPENYEEQMKKIIGRKNLFWWFINPGGKLILDISATYFSDYIYEYHLEKEKVFNLQKDLLKS